MRTYSRVEYENATTAWHDYGPEWSELRAIMAQHTLYPPSGSKWDSREDPEPTQRAILWRALDYRPESTLALARKSRSWSELVRRVILEEGALHDDAALRERDAEWARPDPSSSQAVTLLGDIIERIAASKGVEREG